MIQKHIDNLLYVFVFFLVAVPTTHATVVRMDIAFGDQSTDEIYVELFDAEAPVTTANFLNYIENGSGERRYDGSFIHRSVDGFVVQGGGYVFDPVLGGFGPTSAPHIDTDAPIVNEFDPSRSNLRGTIAMAKLGGDADSATSEWFLNLADNSANLDVQNGGFTVFGRVLGNGMTAADAIAALPLPAPDDGLGSTVFSSLPLVNHSPGSPVTTSHLVTLTKVTASPYSVPLFIDPAPLDFGSVVLTTGPAPRVVSLHNVGDTNLTFGIVGAVDTLEPPFSIETDNCSNQTLTPFSNCTLSILFDPATPGTVQDTFDVPSDDAGQPSVTVSVSGTGSPANPVLQVSPASPIDFGNVALADFADQTISIANNGDGLLQPGTIEIADSDATDFSIVTDNCAGVQLAITETCSITIRFTASSLGNKAATVTVNASPNEQSIQLALNGTAVLSQADLFIPEDGFDMGDTQFDIPLTRDIPLTNQGTEDLIFSSISLTGTDAGQFAITDNCDRVASGTQSCSETVTFTPSGTGPRSAILQVFSNDPDTPVAEIPLRATSSSDGDGIPDAVETAGPNGGDGNRDGIPDLQQHNVTTLLDIHGDYVILEADEGVRLVDVQARENPSPDNTPTTTGGSIDFRHGFYSFVLENVPAGGSATVTMLLPEGHSASNYFKFGRLPGDIPFFPPRWYQFDFDGQTGAEVRGNRITLHFVDGGRGDNDQTADGRIVDPGAPATLSVSGGSSSGGGGGCSLAISPTRGAVWSLDFILLLLTLLCLHCSRKRPYHYRGNAD